VSSSGVCKRVVLLHALAAPGANTNIFTAITPSPNAAAWRVTIALTTSSKVDLRVTDGTTAYSNVLNNDTALAAGGLYTFSFGVAATSTLTGATALTFSLRVQTDSVIRQLYIEEVLGPQL
jgi:hypothetical protein